ncbi:hypothetical protein [Conexibacter sp. CPCC 206217]|uniref:hypothetical protein n=1 Tax=Conexibacter sp. CPCC 206217 TaxID=3064574 RepID=UPI00271A0A28|nr:hypothetical protein [Conexibacter sp. CPCC 206217]MDO8213460.1 hypothetical protein [Conexibacter sp. CPCC 206217]
MKTARRSDQTQSSRRSDRRGLRQRGRDEIVSITPRVTPRGSLTGKIRFNAAVMTHEASAKARYARLFYSRTSRAIAVRLDVEPVTGYRITPAGNAGVIGTVGGFLDHFGLDPMKISGEYRTQRFRARDVGIDLDGEVLVIDLAKPVMRKR